MVHGDNDKDCGGDGSGYGDYSGDNNDALPAQGLTNLLPIS